MAISFTQTLDLKQNRITNLGAPAVSSDAVTKQYVDNIASGLIWKDAVRVAASGNVAVGSPGTAIDGVTLVAGNRVLLMGQTNTIENGLYTYTGTALVRAEDADTDAELRAGTAVTVSEGTNQGNHTYVLITDGPITVGTTGLDWALLNAGTAPVYTAGNAIDITNHVVSVTPATNGGIGVASGVAVLADPDGGLQVGTTGVRTKLAPNPALRADSNGLAFQPRPDFGLANSSDGAGLVIKANTGLAVDGTGLRTVIASNKGLSADNLGLQVVAGNGITTDSTGVVAVADTLGGLQVGTNGIAVKSANAGLASDNSGLTVVPSPNGGLRLVADGVAVKLQANKGLTVDNTGIGVVLRGDDGLDVDATGIGISTDVNGALVTSSTGLAVKAALNAGIAVGAGGVSAVLNNAGGLAVDGSGIKTVQGYGVVVGTDVAVDKAVVPTKFATTVGDGASTTIMVNHNLNTRDVRVELYSTTAPYDTQWAEVQRPDANNVALVFGQAPSSSAYRCLVLG